MKLLLYALFLFLFVIVNSFPFHNDRGSGGKEHDGKGEHDGSCKNRNYIYQQLYNATNRTLSSLLAPLCYQILLEQNNIQQQYISSNGLSGRVIPAGTFTTQVLALEYLYGILCPIPGLPPPLHMVQSYNLTQISYDKDYFRTSNELILNLTGNKLLTFFANMAFDKDYKLCGYEGQIRNFGLTFDTYTEAEHDANINLICNGAQQFCNGTLKQYDSFEACVNYLKTEVPYGSYDSADQGTVVCRLIHIKFVPLVPSIHCPHVGPTGGDACSNKTFSFYYNQPDFLGCAYKYNN